MKNLENQKPLKLKGNKVERSFRYRDGRSPQHRHDARLRDRPLDEPIRHVDDLPHAARHVPLDLRLAAGELGVPHAQEQTDVGREDVEVGPGQGRRDRGARGDKEDSGDRGEEFGEEGGEVRARVVHKTRELPRISDRHHPAERVDVDGGRAPPRLSVVHIRGGGIRGLDQRQHRDDRLRDRDRGQRVRVGGEADRQEIAAAHLDPDLRPLPCHDRDLLRPVVERPRRLRAEMGAHRVPSDLRARIRPRPQPDPPRLYRRDISHGREGARCDILLPLLRRHHDARGEILSGGYPRVQSKNMIFMI